MAMVEIFKPFDVDAFNAINGLGDANHSFKEKSGLELVYSSIFDLFKKHSVIKFFGVSLVHRHFGLAGDEILVETSGTAVAWSTKDAVAFDGSTEASSSTMSTSAPGLQYSKYGGLIKPMSWTFDTTGHLVPYEFFFEPNAQLQPGQPDKAFDNMPLRSFLEKNATFVSEFKTLLEDHGLRDILGLRLLRDSDPSDGTLEFTEHQSNITVPAAPGFIANLPGNGSYIEATWAFKDNATHCPVKKVGFFASACYNMHTKQVHLSAHYAL